MKNEKLTVSDVRKFWCQGDWHSSNLHFSRHTRGAEACFRAIQTQLLKTLFFKDGRAKIQASVLCILKTFLSLKQLPWTSSMERCSPGCADGGKWWAFSGFPHSSFKRFCSHLALIVTKNNFYLIVCTNYFIPHLPFLSHPSLRFSPKEILRESLQSLKGLSALCLLSLLPVVLK